MKTLKSIAITSLVLLGLASCNDTSNNRPVSVSANTQDNKVQAFSVKQAHQNRLDNTKLDSITTVTGETLVRLDSVTNGTIWTVKN